MTGPVCSGTGGPLCSGIGGPLCSGIGGRIAPEYATSTKIAISVMPLAASQRDHLFLEEISKPATTRRSERLNQKSNAIILKTSFTSLIIIMAIFQPKKIWQYFWRKPKDFVIIYELYVSHGFRKVDRGEKQERPSFTEAVLIRNLK